MNYIKKPICLLALFLLFINTSSALYLKFGCGSVLKEDISFKKSSYSFFHKIGTMEDFSVKMDPGLEGHLAIGQRFFDFVILEVEGSALYCKINSLTRDSSITFNNVVVQPYTRSIDKDSSNYFLSVGFMGNLILEKQLVPRTKVYAGAGIGIINSYISSKKFVDVHIDSHLAGQVLTGIRVSPLPFFSVNVGYKGIIESKVKEKNFETKKYPLTHVLEAGLSIGF